MANLKRKSMTPEIIENGLTEIGEFDDDTKTYYKIVDGQNIKIDEHELHSLWMIWIGEKGTMRIVKDNLIRYIFATNKPTPNDKA